MQKKDVKLEKSNLIKYIISFLPALVWMGVIYYGSSQTGDDVGRILPFVQKFFPFIESFNFMHFITYFILAMMFDYGFGQKANLFKYKVIIVLLCVIYGITDEIHQMFVGGRTPDILDIRNDGIGSILWVVLISIPVLQKWWNKLPRKE